MDINKFQFIQGNAEENEEATIRFFDHVDAWSVSSFKDEFEYLEKYIKPSQINIEINTEGGSVLRGMNAFSTIISSKVPTVTIVEGLAASMGSALLAAGKVAKMRDYGIIMIHNPFFGSDPNDPMVVAFKEQLKTIYKKRWGFSDEKITEIMDGESGNDGTYINAEQAVELGIISKDNIIVTPKQHMEEIEAALSGVQSKSKIVKVFASLENTASLTDNKPIVSEKTTLNQKDSSEKTTQNQLNVKNNMDTNLANVAASLQMDKDTSEAVVIARVVELSKVEATITELNDANSALKIEKTGIQTSLDNVQASLTSKEKELVSVNAELTTYKEKELAEVKATQETFIDEAITADKITAESKPQWLTMANTNFEAVKVAIDGMVGKVVISEEIVKDAGKVENVTAQLTETEKTKKAHTEKVVAALGETIEFAKLD